ncbi:MAG TPA: homoserine dehydrogenase [Vicinamibacterales bacterium]|nr:homoserine dehydrogenase [Vicinamibacterales bacterium]
MTAQSRVALVGFGTVGQSVARILSSGEVPQVRLTHIFNRDIARKKVDWVPSHVKWTESIDDVLSAEVDIVIELVGGLRPAYDWVRGALTSGKSVVTANKQLMAHYGTELRDLARSKGLDVRFEASVAGGIPVLRALQEGLAGDRLVEVRGILNGTCNYILSRMQAESIAFADVLADAQKAGFAEADPSEDLDGADAAAKLAIIAAVGLRRPVRVRDIATRSIRPIETVDFEYAKQLGCTIRQIARASAEDSGAVFAAVRPALVPLSSGFGRNEGSQNLVTVRGVFGGETSFSGFGAGGSPTAVAVVSDVLSIAGSERNPVSDAEVPNAATPLHDVSGDFVAPHYVRFTVSDKPGILAAVCAAYARYGINIEGVLQLPRFRKDRLPFVTTLEECPESVLDRALAEVSQSDYHVVPPLSLPMFS